MMRHPLRGSMILAAARRAFIALPLVCVASEVAADDSAAALVRHGIAAATVQYGALLKNVQHKPGFPRTLENGEVRLVDVKDWTAGFFPGSLWYLYEATGEKTWRTAAADYTARTAPAKFDKSQHDLGFMLYAGYGNGYRLTKDPAYRDALLAGATTLITRFNPQVGSIQSWDLWKNTSWAFPVIIDNMMNLELLTWASRATRLRCSRDTA
jgi:hypothetical protein